RIRDSAAFDAGKDPALSGFVNVPAARLYAIDVSFPMLTDKDEFAYLNELPTSFVLPSEAVDRLRAAAGKILLESPDFQRLLKDAGATLVAAPPSPAVRSPTSANQPRSQTIERRPRRIAEPRLGERAPLRMLGRGVTLAPVGF